MRVRRNRCGCEVEVKCKRPCQKARRARVRVVDVRLQHEVRIRPHRARIEGGDRALGNRLRGKGADTGAGDLGRRAAQLGRPRKRGADRRERCSSRKHRASELARDLANNVRLFAPPSGEQPPKKSARPTRVHAWRQRSDHAAVAEPACCCWSSAAGRLSTPTTRSAISRATRTSGASTRARCPSSTFLAKACTRLPRRTRWRCRASCATF